MKFGIFNMSFFIFLTINTTAYAVDQDNSKTINDAASISRKTSVLVLGKDSDPTAKTKLNKVANYLKTKGYSPLILRDINDIDDMSLHEKLILHAVMSKLVVVVDDEISGHAYEAAVVDFIRVPACYIRKKNQGSTFMIADIGYARPTSVIIEYDTDSDLDVAVTNCINRMDSAIIDKKKLLKSLYPWRRGKTEPVAEVK